MIKPFKPREHKRIEIHMGPSKSYLAFFLAVALVAVMPQPSTAVRAEPPYFHHHRCSTIEVAYLQIVEGAAVLLSVADIPPTNA